MLRAFFMRFVPQDCKSSGAVRFYRSSKTAAVLYKVAINKKSADVAVGALHIF